VQTAHADVNRRDVLSTSVATLVQNQLRPGADLSRAQADLAAAKIQLILSQRAAARAHATLAEALGVAGQTVALEAGALLTKTPAAPAISAAPEAHPAAREQQAVIDTAHSRVRALASAYVPRINFQSAVFARGAPPVTAAGTTGLFPTTTSNWAVGLTFSFPVFDVVSIGARRQVELGNEATAKARYDQTVQTLRADEARAKADLDAARLIAENTPIELQAARQAEAQVRARYDASLGTLSEVADVERLLAQAEIDDQLARLGVWRALLAEASAHGDLTLFLSQVK
jgi:outer membrane protein TolC